MLKMSLEFIDKDKKDLIGALKLSIELQKDALKVLQKERKNYSDLNKWLFDAKEYSLITTITILSNHIRNLENSNSQTIPHYLKKPISNTLDKKTFENQNG